MIPRDNLAKLFRILAAAIDGLDQLQLDQLLAGEGKLVFNNAEKVKETGTTRAVDQTTILQELNGCQERDEAHRTLSAITSRDALASFARALKVHVVKRDRREDIESKIIEFVMGGRLRTEAIQSLNLKGFGNTPSKAESEPPKARKNRNPE